MIIKLKCVDNVDYLGLESDYLTTGKVYDAIMSKDDEVALIDDEGELINDNLSDAIHAKWEVVSE